MTVVVVVISFSIIVSCAFISLLLVIVGIIYSHIRMGNVANVIIDILFDGENISFDACLVMYMNSTNIPRIIIINRIYELNVFLTVHHELTIY